MANALGQVVFQQKTPPNATLKADVREWASGIYFVKSDKLDRLFININKKHKKNMKKT
jgi:hypothetical protein